MLIFVQSSLEDRNSFKLDNILRVTTRNIIFIVEDIVATDCDYRDA